jgi:hypothetical protein
MAYINKNEMEGKTRIETKVLLMAVPTVRYSNEYG